MRHFTSFVVLFAFVVAATANLTSYVNSGGTTPITTTTTTDPSAVCARYDFTCGPGDSACTADEIAKSTIKTAVTLMRATDCNSLTNYPTLYRNVYCCNTDKCNAPIGYTSASSIIGPVAALISAVAFFAL